MPKPMTTTIVPNTRLVDLIFDAVRLKLELTRRQARDAERALERFARKYGCGPEDLPALMDAPVPAVSREDALRWYGELVRLERLRDDIAHLSQLS